MKYDYHDYIGKIWNEFENVENQYPAWIMVLNAHKIYCLKHRLKFVIVFYTKIYRIYFNLISIFDFISGKYIYS